jgi:cell division protein FtsW (lipid II flippase)
MRISTELIIVIVAIVLFYLRIAWLRGKKKRLEREFALKRRKVKGRSKGAMLPQKAPGSPPYGITSWFLVALAVLLMLVGMLAYNKFTILSWEIIKDPSMVETYAKYWHWAVAAGVLVFAFCFKIDLPRLENEAE